MLCAAQKGARIHKNNSNDNDDNVMVMFTWMMMMMPVGANVLEYTFPASLRNAQTQTAASAVPLAIAIFDGKHVEKGSREK